MKIDKEIKGYFGEKIARMEYDGTVFREKFDRLKPVLPAVKRERPVFIGQIVSAAGLAVCAVYLIMAFAGLYVPSRLSKYSSEFYVKYDIPGKFEEARKFLEKNFKP
ncbi:MAG: hypothetical protein A2Y33_01070 [Spirochaetes bacterium GWF1_51_8]|nr:MAG: hypothetical protein A2Y33_01070 [Spirochaetes bacterium GWF1_51_8]